VGERVSEKMTKSAQEGAERCSEERDDVEACRREWKRWFVSERVRLCKTVEKGTKEWSEERDDVGA
jgi:hypothetical protein